MSRLIEAVIFDISGVVVFTKASAIYKYTLSGGSLINPVVDEEDRMEKYINLYKQTRRIDENILKLVKELREKGYETPALSNASKEKLEAYKKIGLEGYFEPLISSSELGIDKPRIDAYRKASEIIGIDPKKCVFIDDKKINVIGAREFGWKAIHFKGLEELRAELENMGVLGD